MDLKAIYYNKRKNIKNRCKLDSAHPYFEIIREHFSYHDSASAFSNNDNIPTRKYTIAKNGMMDIGMLWELKRFLKKNDWDFKLDICPETKKRLVNPITFPIVEVPTKKLKMYDYQREAVEKAFKLGGGIEDVGMLSLLENADALSWYEKCSRMISK